MEGNKSSGDDNEIGGIDLGMDHMVEVDVDIDVDIG